MLTISQPGASYDAPVPPSYAPGVDTGGIPISVGFSLRDIPVRYGRGCTCRVKDYDQGPQVDSYETRLGGLLDFAGCNNKYRRKCQEKCIWRFRGQYSRKLLYSKLHCDKSGW